MDLEAAQHNLEYRKTDLRECRKEVSSCQSQNRELEQQIQQQRNARCINTDPSKCLSFVNKVFFTPASPGPCTDVEQFASLPFLEKKQCLDQVLQQDVGPCADQEDPLAKMVCLALNKERLSIENAHFIEFLYHLYPKNPLSGCRQLEKWIHPDLAVVGEENRAIARPLFDKIYQVCSALKPHFSRVGSGNGD